MSNRKCIFQEIQNAGERIMLNPVEPLDFQNFYKKIIGSNTLRAFHRNDVNKIGPTEIVRDFIINSKDFIIDGLKETKSNRDIDLLSHELFKELKSKLELNVKKEILDIYNCVRKLVDLILEHFALVAKELNTYRNLIISYLRVPLDSFILNSDCLFTYKEREKLGLKIKGGGFLSVTNQKQYNDIQNHLIQVSKSCEISYPIYFDVLWRDRIHYTNNINL